MAEFTGARIGDAIGNLIAAKMMDSRKVMLDHEAAHAERTRVEQWERMERELATKLQEIGINPAADGQLPDEVRQAFASINVPTHQVDFIFNLVALIGVALTGAFAAAAGLDQQLTQRGLYKHAFVVPEPTQLAGMVSGGVLERGQAMEWAQFNGMRPEVMQYLIESSWRELTPAEAVDLYRRHHLGAAQLADALSHSGMRDYAIGAIQAGVYGPPSADVAITALVQTQLDAAEVDDLLAQNGIDPKHRDWLFRTAGQPPGVQELLELLNRNEISEQVVRDAIAESRVKTKYTDPILKMRFKIPPERSIISMLRYGVITIDTALHWLQAHGFSPEASAALTAEATQTKHEAAHDLSTAQLVELYELGQRSKDQTSAALQAIGYDADEAAWLMTIADLRRQRKQLDQGAARVRAAYLSHRIDEQTASTALDAIGVAPTARDDLLDQWDTERAVNVRVLSEAQWIAAAKKQAVTWQRVAAELVAMGYSADHAAILINTAAPGALEGGKANG